MTKKQAKEECLAKLLLCRKELDVEERHIDADSALCDLLLILDCEEVVDAYQRLFKLYG